MRAFVVYQTVDHFTFEIEDRPEPRPACGEVLVAVSAAGITPTELQWYPTTHRADGTTRVSAVPCHEFAGVVAAVGEGVDAFSVGEAVYGMNGWFAEGAAADYCISQPSSLARTPPNLTDVTAAAAPISLLTAHEGLISRAKLQASERVLIHGAAGAVGLCAVQIAVRAGAEVIATANPGAYEMLRSLGVQHLIDYTKERFEDVAGEVDVVFDAVGGDILLRSQKNLRAGGRMVTIAADAEKVSAGVIKDAFFIVEPNGPVLDAYSADLGSGALRLFVKGTVKLEDAEKAFTGTIPGSTLFGKGVIIVR